MTRTKDLGEVAENLSTAFQCEHILAVLDRNDRSKINYLNKAVAFFESAKKGLLSAEGAKINISFSQFLEDLKNCQTARFNFYICHPELFDDCINTLTAIRDNKPYNNSYKKLLIEGYTSLSKSASQKISNLTHYGCH